MKNRKKKPNPLFLITLAVALVAVLGGLILLSGWLGKNEKPEGSGDDQSMLMSIETPYATLKYPAQWEKNLYHEGKTENGIYTETFFCCVDDERIELFRVHFGAPDVGSLIGYTISDGAPVAFSVEGADIAKDPSWTEETRIMVYAMAEGINTVIESFLADHAAGE